MNSADEAFNELIRKEMEIFNKLMGKKVKIDKDYNFNLIIGKLKNNNIHTRYIENKDSVHSLFFLGDETSFLPFKSVSDTEFLESSLKEISFEEFLNILDLPFGGDVCVGNKFIKIKTIEDSTYIINIDKIDYCKLHHNSLITVVKNRILELNINNNENKKFLKILGV